MKWEREKKKIRDKYGIIVKILFEIDWNVARNEGERFKGSETHKHKLRHSFFCLVVVAGVLFRT